MRGALRRTSDSRMRDTAAAPILASGAEFRAVQDSDMALIRSRAGASRSLSSLRACCSQRGGMRTHRVSI